MTEPSSKPGDPGRRQIMATDPDETAQALIEVCSSIPGIRSFEVKYSVPGRELAEGEEPRDDEPVLWTAEVEIRRTVSGQRCKLVYTGKARVEPGGAHGRGLMYALADLAEKLGANVVLVDVTDGADPRQVVEGWAFPPSTAGRAHYFRAGTSLCGRFEVGDLVLEPDNGPGIEDCSSCARELRGKK